MAVNAMKVSAGEALDALRAGWAAQKAGTLKSAWMLHGRPGVGKTQLVTTLAREIGAELYDLRLTTIEPQDLRGLPYYDHDAKQTQWYRPEDLPSDPDRPAVLFLDELTAASAYLQPTVYGLLQERRVGRHRLPDSVFLVAAGNKVEDGAIAYDMGTGLSDRLIHMEVVANARDWVDNYAVPAGLHSAVTGFIRTRPDLLETTEQTLAKGQIIACTPRSWERVSAILATNPARRMRDILVAGTVGEAVAAEFALVADDVAASVQIEEMLSVGQNDRWPLYPDTMHGLNALIFGLIGALSASTANAVIETMAGIRHLAQHRVEEGFRRMPLEELATYGFEMLIRKGLAEGLEQAFLGSDDFKAYARDKDAAGLL